MKDYKRLTTKKYGTYLASCENCGYNNPSFDCDTYNCKQVLIKRLAELEDKIENGTLKFLQCKVGDIVYFIDEKKWCWEMIVVEIAILKKHIVYKIGNGRKELRYVYDEDLGKKWFLTKAEAEKKLEELKNENTCKQQDKN